MADAETGGSLQFYRVVDLSTGIAAAYCAKLLADAGADVIKVEPPEGDPWRAWSVAGAMVDVAEGGALFRFLHHGVRSVVGEGSTVDDLVDGADLVIESDDDIGSRLRGRHPGVVWLSITPFGLIGPMADHPWSELTVQAVAGGVLGRGDPDHEPFMAGGRISEWVSGTFAAVAALAALRRASTTGHGEHIDHSTMATMAIAGSNYADVHHAIAGRPELRTVARSLETPSIEPTADGYVGFTTNSRQQFDDFLLLIERADLLGDDDLARLNVRQARRVEWNEIVRSWTTQHATAEVVRRATELRIPVAPVNDADGVLANVHFSARGAYVDDPTGTFRMPRRPWRMNGVDPPPPRPAPRLGEHSGQIEPRVASRPTPVGAPPLPLAGLRILDLTAWWAGPMATGVLAALGADVIHVESERRPDGMRMAGAVFGMDEHWMERSAFFLAANTNKRGITLDLTSPEGAAHLLALVADADAVVENFSPRVLDNFGLGWERIRAANPRCLLVRMPAFGLDGPWRDSVGFAQTMEQVSGLAWLTGPSWDQPRIQRGPSDPNAGMHAAVALLVALAERDRTGVGAVLEVAMVEGALNAAAEIVIERTAYGNRLARDGNRVRAAAPQGVYRCAGFDSWLAISVLDDRQWSGLRAALGQPAWTAATGLDHHDGRLAAHDEIDAHLAAWTADRDADETAGHLIVHGVPAARLQDPRLLHDNVQLIATGYHEEIEHPVVGAIRLPTPPFRFASIDRWLRAPAPTLGQHNPDVVS